MANITRCNSVGGATLMALQKPEWFRMDPAKFLSDGQVDAMSTLELGACLRLLCRQWLDGFIPDDLRVLGRLCRLDASGMREAWTTLQTFFPVVEPGKRANRFMWIEREKVVADLEKRSDEGTRAARKRWDARNGTPNGSPIAEPNRLPMPQPMQEQSRAEQTRAETSSAHPSGERKDGNASVAEKKLKLAALTVLANGIYNEYPRKVGKADALDAAVKAIQKIAIRGATELHPDFKGDPGLAASWLVGRVQQYAASPDGTRPDKDKIPHPATWIHRGRYDDDPQEWTHVGNDFDQRVRRGPVNGTGVPSGYVSASKKIREQAEKNQAEKVRAQ